MKAPANVLIIIISLIGIALMTCPTDASMYDAYRVTTGTGIIGQFIINDHTMRIVDQKVYKELYDPVGKRVAVGFFGKVVVTDQ